MKNIEQELVGKTIARVELDTEERFGFDPVRDKALSTLIFTDGTRLEVEAIMAGATIPGLFLR